MFDHLCLNINNLQKSRAFYDAAFLPLGLSSLMQYENLVAYGRNDTPQYFLAQKSKTQLEAPLHIAFSALSRADVDHFHAAALAAGGLDNGQPGIRAQYHPNYYAAYVIDPDGHNIEAVCHVAE